MSDDGRIQMLIIVVIITLLCTQVTYASDPREPVPISMNHLPNGLTIQEVACSYFNKDALSTSRLKIVRSESFMLDSANRALKVRMLNLRDISKGEISNNAFMTGLSLYNGQANRCYIVKPLCDESDIGNVFDRIDYKTSGKEEEFIHIGFRIIDDCDEVHGGLNEPSCFVVTANKKTLALDMNRFYYERPRFGDDQLPFDNSAELKYSRGYRHLPIK